MFLNLLESLRDHSLWQREYKELTANNMWRVIDMCVQNGTPDIEIIALINIAKEHATDITPHFLRLTLQRASMFRSEAIMNNLIDLAVVVKKGLPYVPEVPEVPGYLAWLDMGDRWLSNVDTYCSWSIVARALDLTSPDIVHESDRFRLMAIMVGAHERVRYKTNDETTICTNATADMESSRIRFDNVFVGTLNSDCASIVFCFWFSYEMIGAAILEHYIRVSIDSTGFCSRPRWMRECPYVHNATAIIDRYGRIMR